MKKDKKKDHHEEEELDVVSLYRPFLRRRKKSKYYPDIKDNSMYQAEDTSEQNYVQNDNQLAKGNQSSVFVRKRVDVKQVDGFETDEESASVLANNTALVVPVKGQRKTSDGIYESNNVTEPIDEIDVDDTGEKYAGVFLRKKTENEGARGFDEIISDGSQIEKETDGDTSAYEKDNDEIFVLEQKQAEIAAQGLSQRDISEEGVIGSNHIDSDVLIEDNPEETRPWLKLQISQLQKRRKYDQKSKASGIISGADYSEEISGPSDEEVGEHGSINGTAKKTRGRKRKYGAADNGYSSRSDNNSSSGGFSGVFHTNKTDSSSVFRKDKNGSGKNSKSDSEKNNEKSKDTESTGSKFRSVFNVVSGEAKEAKRSIKNATKFGQDTEDSEDGGNAAYNAGKRLAQEMIAKTKHLIKQVKTVVVLVLSAVFGPIVSLVAALIGPILFLLFIVIIIVVVVIAIIVSLIVGIFSAIVSVFVSLFSTDYNTASPIYQYALEYSKAYAEEVAVAYKDNSFLTATVDGINGYPVNEIEVDFEQVYLCYLFTHEQAEYTEDLEIDKKGHHSNIEEYYAATDMNKESFEKIFDEMYSIETDEKGKVTVTVTSAEKYWKDLAATYDYQDDNYNLFYAAITGEDEEKKEVAKKNTQMMSYGEAWKIREMEVQ